MTLAEFISDLNMSPETFAEAHAEALDGASSGAVRKWMSGERIPRKEQMEKIYAVTGGKVTPNDFYKIGVGSREPSEVSA